MANKSVNHTKTATSVSQCELVVLTNAKVLGTLFKQRVGDPLRLRFLAQKGGGGHLLLPLLRFRLKIQSRTRL